MGKMDSNKIKAVLYQFVIITMMKFIISTMCSCKINWKKKFIKNVLNMKFLAIKRITIIIVFLLIITKTMKISKNNSL